MIALIHTYKGKPALERFLRALAMRYGGQTPVRDVVVAAFQRSSGRTA